MRKNGREMTLKSVREITFTFLSMSGRKFDGRVKIRTTDFLKKV